MAEVQLFGRNRYKNQQTELKQLVPQVKLRDTANIEVRHEDYLRKFPQNYPSTDQLKVYGSSSKQDSDPNKFLRSISLLRP